VPHLRPRLKEKSSTLKIFSVVAPLKVKETDVLQQGVAGDFHSELLQEPRSGLSSKSKRDVGEPAIQSVGATRVVTREPGRPLSEDVSLAGPLIAEVPSDVQAQGDGYSLPGKVAESSDVARVNPMGRLTT